MKKILYLLFLVQLSFFSYTCKNPTDDITVTINADIFKLKRSVRVFNAKDGQALPSGLTVEITGPDAAAIYSLAATKTFTVDADGRINLGIDPRQMPTEGNPLQFNVKVSGANIMNVNIPFTVDSKDAFEEKPVYVLDLNNPVEGVSVEKPSVALAGNAVASDVTIGTRAENGTSMVTTIDIDAGTQFRDANGAVLSGGTLATTLVNIDPRSEGGLSVFPGGSLSSEMIRDASGNIIAGTFNPAAVTDIEFTVGGQEVSSFSKPITITQDIDPTYINSATNAVAKVGDIISVYSYKSETGMFQYEGPGTVVQNGSSLALEYQVTHLTTWIGSDLGEACASSSLRLDGSAWMQEGVSYPLRVSVSNTTGNVFESVFDITSVANQVRLPVIPTGPVTVTVSHANTGQQIANQTVNIDCGSTNTVTLSALTEQPVVSLQLYVRCPGQPVRVEVLPTFILYYRETGTANFNLLGTVSNGFISTTTLDVNKRYDFRAVWGDKVKTVGNKQVAAVNVATVGDNAAAGEIIGEKAPQNNLKMLEEACK